MANRTQSSVEDRVRQIIVEQVGIDSSEVTRDAHFVNDLGLDSLDSIEVIMAIEEEFDLEIPDDKAEEMQIVSQVFDYVAAKAKV